FFLVGISGHLNQGYMFRYPDDLNLMVSTAERSPLRERCHTSGRSYLPPANACEYFGEDIKWAILGDSHAVELGYALGDSLREKNEGLKHLSFSSCGPELLYKTNTIGCARWLKEAVSEIQGNADIENVLISYFYISQQNMRGIDNEYVDRYGSESDLRDLYFDSLEALVV